MSKKKLSHILEELMEEALKELSNLYVAPRFNLEQKRDVRHVEVSRER